MQYFFLLFSKILLLYSFVILGYFLEKFTPVKNKLVSNILIYILLPIFMFDVMRKISFSTSTILFPLIFAVLASTITFFSYKLSRNLWSDNRRNLFAYMSGVSNVAFLGVPIALILFDEKIVLLYSLAVAALNITQFAINTPILAKKHDSFFMGIQKVMKLPIVYAIILGIIFNLLKLDLTPLTEGIIETGKTGLTILGMSIIGMALVGFDRKAFDKKLIAASFFVKFVVWPLSVLLIILTDKIFFNLYNTQIYQAMMLLATVPVAAATITFSIKYNTYPKKASLVVLSTTITSLIIIPLSISALKLLLNIFN